MAAINIIQHSNSIPEKSQRKADNDQAATSPNHLFLLVVVFPSGYHAELHLGQKIEGGWGAGGRSYFKGNRKRKLKYI